MCPLLSAATLKSISEVVFGCPVEDLGADFVEHNSHIVQLTASQSASQVLFDLIAAHLPQWFLHQAVHLPTKTFGALRAQIHFAEREGWRLVREKTEAAKLGLETDGDLYGVLLNSVRSDSNSLREEDIVSQTSVLMIAGQDTTANTLAFGLIELGKNPQFQDSLRAEIHAAVGTGYNNISYDSMPLLNAFITALCGTTEHLPRAQIWSVSLKNWIVQTARLIRNGWPAQNAHIQCGRFSQAKDMDLNVFLA